MKKTKLRTICLDMLAMLCLLVFIFPACAQQDKEENPVRSEDEIIVKATIKLLEELHYSKPQMDDKVSSMLFDEYLEKLDPNRHFFMQEDIQVFNTYRDQLDDMLKKGDAQFAFIVYRRYLERVHERIEFVKTTVEEKMDFSAKESMLIERKNCPWPKNPEELNEIWRQQIKNQFLQNKLKEIFAKDHEKNTKAKAKDEIVQRYERYYKFLKGNDKYDILEYYLSALTGLFDPHTSYLNWRTLDDFNISLRLSLEGIGAVLTTEDGYPKVVHIVPGGPADKQGQLKAGYRIVAVGEGDNPPENIVDIPLTKSVQKIRGKKGTKVTLTVMKSAQDVPFDIIITRDEIKLTEQAAKGEIKNMPVPGGSKKLGIVYLPSFYADFEALSRNDPNARSTVRDVREIVDKMIKTDHIDGLIIDLRSNSGGSLEEVIGLTGLFIPSGPVVQIMAGEYKYVREDQDGGFAYDIPLLVMVDAFSASASEIFAGAIQDYKRGIVVGQRTYGKGTVQNLLNLGRLGIGKADKLGALKYTMAKFYRITGASTQQRGVTPDILLPTFFTADEYGENSLPHVMPWSEISPLSNYNSKFQATSYISHLQKRYNERIKNDKQFQQLTQYIEMWNARRNRPSISLNFEERLALKKEEDVWYNRIEEMLNSKLSTVGEESKKEKDDWYLEENLRIMADMLELMQKDDRRK